MRQLFRRERFWSKPQLKNSYDVVIIGGGAHGLALATYLARRGIRDVAVLERNYIGSGGSGRSTALIRADYRTPEAIQFYKESLRLYEDLSVDLGFNLLFSQPGRLTLAHSQSAINRLRERTAANQVYGVETRWLTVEEIKDMVPALAESGNSRHPILAGMFHAPAGFIRHDAVVWAYARAASRLGVEIHSKTTVRDITIKGAAVTGVETDQGYVRTGVVVNATAGWCSTIARMVDLDLPVVTHPLQACVTEALKPILDVVIVSDDFHVYCYQTGRGEIVIGGQTEPFNSYNMGSSLHYLKTVATYLVELLPTLADVRILRQWAGLCDLTPDMCPLLGPVESLKGFVLDCGWGTFGFRAVPAAGLYLAEYIDTGNMPEIIQPFTLSRIYAGNLIDEAGSAASGIS